MISPLVPSFNHNNFMIFIPSPFDAVNITFTLVSLSVSFLFLPTDYWPTSLCPKMASLLTLSKFKPFSNFLLLAPFSNYKASKAKPTSFVDLFLTMPPLHIGFFDPLIYHSICLGWPISVVFWCPQMCSHFHSLDYPTYLWKGLHLVYLNFHLFGCQGCNPRIHY